MIFPELNPKGSDKEYKNCPEKLRDEIVYQYLFYGRTRWWLDNNILGIKSLDNHGWISKGVLNYLGLFDNYQGIFRNIKLEDGIKYLIDFDKKKNESIILTLSRYSLNNYSEDCIGLLNSKDKQIVSSKKELNDEFIKAFPDALEELVLQQDTDSNHFIFSHSSNIVIDEDEGEEYSEGKAAFITHRVRERNHEVIKKAKERFLKRNNGQLFCEACKFNFIKFYGVRGINFIEGHHNKLVSEMEEGEKTKVDDISMLCSNCHRMIHKKPFVTVEELSKLIEENRKDKK